MALLPSDPEVQKKLVIALAPLLLLLAYWYFLHGPKQKELAALETRLESLEAQNSSARARAQHGGLDLEKKLALYEEHIRHLEELVPRSEEVPELLYDLTLRARENGVELALLNPDDEEYGAHYILRTYNVAVYGTYHDIAGYLTAIGSLSRIVTPFDLKLQPRQEQTRSDAVRLQAEFKIKTYVLPPAVQAAS